LICGFAVLALCWASLAFAEEIRVAQLPIEARATLELIKAGGPFPYAQDGRAFGNRERQLPRQEPGYYREYTVRTPGVRDRGARRIVAGGGGEHYYTDDHYRTFKRILE
jgi:ribonuclease T1